MAYEKLVFDYKKSCIVRWTGQVEVVFLYKTASKISHHNHEWNLMACISFLVNAVLKPLFYKFRVDYMADPKTESHMDWFWLVLCETRNRTPLITSLQFYLLYLSLKQNWQSISLSSSDI